MKERERVPPGKRKPRRLPSQVKRGLIFKKIKNKGMKKTAISLIIATMLATISLAASTLASSSTGELVLKLMFFISLIVVDAYAILKILRKE